MIFDTSCCEQAIAENIKELGAYFDIQIGKGVRLSLIPSDYFEVRKQGDEAEIYYQAQSQIYKGIGILLQKQNEDFAKRYDPVFEDLAVMEDMSRNAVMTVPAVKRLIATLAVLGYNQLELYIEDTYKLAGEPYFGTFRGGYTVKELEGIDEYGKRYGVEIVACVQTLAHLKNILKWKPYASTVWDCDDILLCGEEKTYELLDKMIGHISKCISSRKINIGFDEAHRVGLGKYLDMHGYEDRYNLLFKHLERICAILKKYDMQPIMWSDMFFKLIGGGYYNDNPIPQSVIDRVPKEMALCYWHYYCKDKSAYDRMMKRHLEFGREVWFAGGATSWMTFTPSNTFTEGIIDASFESCKEHGIKHYVLTDWGDDGGECSIFSSLPILYRLAEKAYGEFDEKGFAYLFGLSYQAFSTLDYPVILNAGQDELSNSAKYIFYNDCLCGLLDKNIQIDEEFYRDQLKKIPQGKSEYACLFDMQKALMEVVLIKWDIGQKTRAFYQKGDKEGLRTLLETKYHPLLPAIETFYTAFKKVWFTYNKAFGWEVQDIRFGGAIRRIEFSIARLEAYIRDEIKNIEELEEEICYFDGNESITAFRVPTWSSIVSANNI